MRVHKLIAALLITAGACCLCVDTTSAEAAFAETMLVLLAGTVMIGAGMLLAVKGGARE